VRSVVSSEGTRYKGPAVQSSLSTAIHYWSSLADHLYKWEGVENAGGGEGCKRTQWMHANSVGESMSDTCGYKNLPNLLRRQSQKLAYCERECVYVRVCMCQCVSVGKTLLGVYVCVLMRVRRVFGRVLWRASSYVCHCVCIDVCVYVCRPVMLWK